MPSCLDKKPKQLIKVQVQELLDNKFKDNFRIFKSNSKEENELFYIDKFKV